MSGSKKYLPKIVIEEIEDLKKEHHIDKNVVAMEKMVEYTRVGREMERIMRFKFDHKPTKMRRRGWF